MLRSFALPIVIVLSGLLAAGACGFPRFNYTDDEPTPTGGAGGTSVGGGGIGGMPTTGGGGQGGVGNRGGAGGMLPECSADSLGLVGLCSAGNKCTVTDPATGAVGCDTAGPKPLWERCTDDSDCVDGSWCDLNRNICKPFCQNVSGCSDFSGECVAAEQAGTSDAIPGVKTCISMCNPVAGTPCATTMGVTCIFVGANQFDCAESQGLQVNSQCQVQADCGASLGCIDDPIIFKFCEYWCNPIGSTPSECGSDDCDALDPQIFYMGVEHGTCAP